MTVHDAVIGGVLWVLLFYPMWSPRCRRIRAGKLQPVATPTVQEIKVSRNRMTGPNWEQDTIWPEVFEMGDDDL